MYLATILSARRKKNIFGLLGIYIVAILCSPIIASLSRSEGAFVMQSYIQMLMEVGGIILMIVWGADWYQTLIQTKMIGLLQIKKAQSWIYIWTHIRVIVTYTVGWIASTVGIAYILGYGPMIDVFFVSTLAIKMLVVGILVWICLLGMHIYMAYMVTGIIYMLAHGISYLLYVAQHTHKNPINAGILEYVSYILPRFDLLMTVGQSTQGYIAVVVGHGIYSIVLLMIAYLVLSARPGSGK